jgi:TolB-like protein/Flp pilus assembly protein TadD/DNA-binding winged helix-turn-helix (wHTH) protein
MTFVIQNGFRLHDYEVIPSEQAIAGPQGKQVIRPLSMELLLILAGQVGKFIDKDELLSRAGIAEQDGGSELLDACIRELSLCLDDTDSEFIQHDKERGYRLLARPTPPEDHVFETDAGPIHVQPLKGQSTGDYLLQTSSGPVVLHPVAEGEDVEWVGWFSELKRRRVFRAVAAYAVMAWLIAQIIDVLSDALPVLPDWTLTATITVLAVGFPVVAIFAWVFQITPQGIVTNRDLRKLEFTVDRSRLVHHVDLFVIGVLLVIVAFLSWGRIFPVLPGDEQATIAVLPFESLGADDSDTYLGDGIADDIRHRLTDVPQILVAARTSSRALFRNGLDIATIGQRLGVSHVLEGTFRRVDDQVSLKVQLVDVESGFNLWNKTYETRIDDVLELQNKVSLVVASELKVALSPELRETLAENVTDDPLAFDLYLRAQNYLDQPRSTENLEQALGLFREAVSEDPDFALGHAGLCQTFIARFQHSGDTAFVEKAESNCNKSLALDASLSEVHTALGDLRLLSGEFEDARVSFERATAIDPRAVGALAGLGDVYARQANVVGAEVEYKKAIDMQPGNWNGYNRYGRFLIQQGRFDEAIEQYRHSIQLAPDNAHGYNNLGVIYYLKGDFANAADSYDQSLELEPGRAAYSNTGTMHYYARRFERAAELFKRAAEEAETDYRLWGNLADAQRFDTTATDEWEGSYQRAIGLATRQLEVNPNDADTLTNVAWYYANLGDEQTAKGMLERARSLAPSDPGQPYVAALAYVLLDDMANAREALDLAVSRGFPRTIIEATPELENSPIIDN